MELFYSRSVHRSVRSLPTSWTAASFLLLLVLLVPATGCDVLGLGDSDGSSNGSSSTNRFVEIFQDASSQSAVYVTHADTVVTAYNPDLKLPLASTVKYIVAIKYARQAAEGQIDPDSLVALEQVNRFFINFGTGANNLHLDWIEQARRNDRVSNGRVPLREVARGMMDFSSNPATEYLMDLLTLNEVNQTLAKLGLDQHDPLYYFPSAVYIGEEQGLEGNERAQFVRNLTPEERASRAAEIHRKHAQDADSSYRASLELPGLSAQYAWSDHLPASTAREYADLMSRINDRVLLNDEARGFLYEVINGIVRVNPDNEERFSYAGVKGGSTAWVLTEAAFFTERDGGTQTEYAVLFDGSREAQDRLSESFNDFRLGVLGDRSFRRELAQQLGSGS